MELKEVSELLEIDESADSLRSGWDESQASIPSKTPFFLEQDFVIQSCGKLGFPRAASSEAAAAAAAAASSGALLSLAWHCHKRLFGARPCPPGEVRSWPTLDSLSRSMGRHSGFFYILILFSGLEGLIERLEDARRLRNIPRKIIDATVRDMESDLSGYFKSCGGFPPGSLVFRVYTNFGGEYFRLGRLCFHIKPFNGPVRFFRRADSGDFLALSEDGIRYRDGGKLVSPESCAEEQSWRAVFQKTAEGCSGNPVLPSGKALERRVFLPAGGWTEALSREDTVLDIHIPGGSPMFFEECGKSLSEAAEFFRRHFPERPFKGFACSSWLLDSALEEFLPCESNIIRFQREFYLFPCIPGSGPLVTGVLGKNPPSAAYRAAGTSLQRKIVEHLRTGREIPSGGGGGFIPGRGQEWGASRNRTFAFPDENPPGWSQPLVNQ